MEEGAAKIFLNGAVSRFDRQLSALEESYAAVDGRSFSELLDFSVGFARLINYFDLDDEPDGDWVEFFLSDPTVVLASIEARNLAAAENRFERFDHWTREARNEERKFELLRQTFRSTLELARWVNLWLIGARKAPEGEVTRQLLETIFGAIRRDLGQRLRTLKAYDEGAASPTALGEAIGLDYEGFLPIWELQSVQPDDSIYRGQTYARRIDHALPHLDPIFTAFSGSIDELESFSRQNLRATLEQSNHKPQIALFIAFARLFDHAQRTVNAFSRRYARFYYRDVLRERHRGAEPDSVYLAFTLVEDEEVESTTVPVGTLFPAGLDAEDRDILYAADRSIEVIAATLDLLRALRVVRGPLTGEDTSPANEVIQQVFATEIFGEEEAETEGMPAEPWATFGEAGAGADSDEGTVPATVGFALASPYLLLTGGDRSVAVSVDFGALYAREVLAPRLRELAEASGLDHPEEVFRRVLEDGLELYLSTAGGWFAVQGFTVEVESDTRFKLCFYLPATAPPVVAYDPDDEEGGEEEGGDLITDDPRVVASDPAPDLPTLKVYLRGSAVPLGEASPVSPDSPDSGAVSVYPLSLLAEMDVEAFGIRVHVSRLGDLEIENTDGTVDASVPFALFGGSPVVGSYVRIAQPELFAKTPERLWIDVDWFNLPSNDTGFKGYYRDYVIGTSGLHEWNLFDNRKFRGFFSVENPGSWCLAGEASPEEASPPCGEESGAEVFLFRSHPTSPDDESDCGLDEPTADGKLCPSTAFDDLEVVPVLQTPDYWEPTDSAIRLELNRPAYGFGEELYAINVLNSVVKDLPDPDACEVTCAAECDPILEAAEIVGDCIACIEEAVALLGDTSPEEPLDQALADCLARCQRQLAFLFAARVIRCLVSAAATPRVKRARELADEISSSGEPSRLPPRDLERLRDELLELLETSPHDQRKEDELDCIRYALPILEGLILVAATELGCGTSDSSVDCLLDGLAAAQSQLTTANTECVQRCMEECVSISKELRYPNEPYLPEVERLTVDYQAECWIQPAGGSQTRLQGRFYHLTPFGGYSRVTWSSGDAFLLPQFPDSGSLLMGWSRLRGPRWLKLLFEMTATPGEEGSGLPRVDWSYLEGERWRSLPVDADGTHGLRNSGIVSLEVPNGLRPTATTLLPSDYLWTRASVVTAAGSFPDTAGIFPHAGPATWVADGGAGEHLSQPLPAGTIDSSVEDLPDVAAILQPIESFGGRPREDRRSFDIRMGERLRHKQRALLSWDYERLVLEAFPTVWKVQALPARTPERQRVPSNVVVVVVPGADSPQLLDSTAPVATSAQLTDISDYLEGLVSPFVCLHVVNPVYVRIEVTATVTLSSSDDPGELIERLDRELIEYLSPWFYSAARAATRGRYASEADIAEFIRTRPYVQTLASIEPLTYHPALEELDSDWCFLTSAESHSLSATGSGSASD